MQIVRMRSVLFLWYSIRHAEYSLFFLTFVAKITKKEKYGSNRRCGGKSGCISRKISL